MSSTVWQPCNDIHYLCGRRLRCRRTLFCAYSVGAWIVFYDVTLEHDSSFVFLVLWFQVRTCEVAYVHQCSTVWTFLFSVCASRITSCLLLTLSSCHVGIFWSCSHSLPTAAFTSRIFIAWCMGTNSSNSN